MPLLSLLTHASSASPFSHIFMLQVYSHMCQMPTYSIPANLGQDNIFKLHIVLGPRYYYVCSKHASQHICGPATTDPANSIKYMHTSTMPADIYVGPL